MTATAPVVLTPGRWTAVPARCTATFTVGNLRSVVHGSLAVRSGGLVVGEDGRPVAVRGELDLRTVETGHRKRDADLRKKHLLDVDAHPLMTFSCDDVHPEGAGWRAEGTLALRGTSCPLSVTGTVDSSSPDTVHTVGTAVLDRTAIGIRAPRLMIGRLVTITVEAWLTPAR